MARQRLCGPVVPNRVPNDAKRSSCGNQFVEPHILYHGKAVPHCLYLFTVRKSHLGVIEFSRH